MRRVATLPSAPQTKLCKSKWILRGGTLTAVNMCTVCATPTPTATPFTVIVFCPCQSCRRDLPRIVASNSHQFLVFAAFSINIQIANRNLLGKTDTHPPPFRRNVNKYPYINRYGKLGRSIPWNRWPQSPGIVDLSPTPISIYLWRL